VSAALSISAGISHSENLIQLIFGLSLVKCENYDEYKILKRKKNIYLIVILSVWAALILLYLLLGLLVGSGYAAGGQMILFTLLGTQLLIINRVLHNQMKVIFGDRMNDDTFKREKLYLFLTLIFFSISYLIDVARNAITYVIIKSHAEDS